jgi:hypothetical protein
MDFGYTEQRPNTLARRGDEIGLKARSQPTGIAARDCAVDNVIPGLSACAVSGRRSPLRLRSTETGDMRENRPLLEKDGIEKKLAAATAKTKATVRTLKIRPIGPSADFHSPFSPTHRHRWRGNKTKRLQQSSPRVQLSPACDQKLTRA